MTPVGKEQAFELLHDIKMGPEFLHFLLQYKLLDRRDSPLCRMLYDYVNQERCDLYLDLARARTPIEVARAMNFEFIPDPQFAFIRFGPPRLFKVAHLVASILRRFNVRFALGGSFSIFAQCPFRLSADADFVIEDKLNIKVVKDIALALHAAGIKVGRIRTHEINAQYIAEFPLSIDIEIGCLYGEPIRNGELNILNWKCEIPMISADMLFEYKARSPRLKDARDELLLKERR